MVYQKVGALNIPEAKLLLVEAGTAYGRDYKLFRQNASKISDDIEDAAKSKLAELDEEQPTGAMMHLFNILLFLAGLVFLSLSMTNSVFWQVWFWISFFWVIGVVIAFSRGGNKIDFSNNEELFDAFFDSAATEIENKRKSIEVSSKKIEQKIRQRGPKPLPQPYGVSHEGAEALCAAWMRHLGEMDAEFTRVVGDGGIDVQSSRFIGQVKNYAGSVGVASIRELAGVAVVDGRKALFFTSGTYASGAINFANQSGIALFVYDAVAGSLSSANQLAKKVISTGLLADF